MNKMVLRVLICVAVLMNMGTMSFAVEAESGAYQIPVNDDGDEAVTLESTDGTKVVVYLLRETEDQLFLQNLNDSMEFSFPRSRVAEIRKPTAKEISKQQKALGMQAKPRPSQKTKK